MHTDNLRPTELAGLLWMWRRGDRVISLPPLTGFRVTTSPATDVLTALCELEAAEITARLYTRHRPYIAWIEQMPVAYGWSASGQATFGAPPVSFDVPPGNHYLMDFATLPEWRGRSIYPHLLQSIIVAETDAGRFWILHRHNNHALTRGIEKAGFTCVARIYFLESGGLGLVPINSAADRCIIASGVFGLPVVELKRRY